MHSIAVINKARALETAFKEVGAKEYVFLCEVLPSVDNQCTNNTEADDILEDLRAVYEGGFEFTNQRREEFVCMIRKLYECESAMHYATLMTFGHYEKPRDVEQIMCGEFANLSNGDWGVELDNPSRAEDTNRIFEFIQHGLYEVVREVLCKYVMELQKQSAED